MNIHEIVQHTNHGDKYCRFTNDDGKMWIMPMKNMRTAMNLYQPSGLKGRMLKRWLPSISVCRLVHRVIHAEQLQCKLRNDLWELLTKVINVDDIEFSVFGGTPCVHQKVTIQLSRGEQIIGYCKLSDNLEIIDLFHRETKILKVLAEQGMTDCIPQVLYCGHLSDGVGVFVQSSIKSNNSYILHEWSELHNDFVLRLESATKQRILFEKSDYYSTLTDMQAHLDWLPDVESQKLIGKSIDVVLSEYVDKEVELSAYHADFTPWNMFIEKGKLFVFDLEYAQLSYPSGLDRYHFFTQSAIFEKHWDAKDIIAFLHSPKAAWVDRRLYLYYVLDVISRFTLRDKGGKNDDYIMMFNIWVNLLKELNS